MVGDLSLADGGKKISLRVEIILKNTRHHRNIPLITSLRLKLLLFLHGDSLFSIFKRIQYFVVNLSVFLFLGPHKKCIGYSLDKIRHMYLNFWFVAFDCRHLLLK